MDSWDAQLRKKVHGARCICREMPCHEQILTGLLCGRLELHYRKGRSYNCRWELDEIRF